MVDLAASLPRSRVASKLIIHSRDDAFIPMKDGIELATGI